MSIEIFTIGNLNKSENCHGTLRALSVDGCSQGNGPTFDCHTKLYGLHIFNSSITSATDAPTSDGYASPRLTVYQERQTN